MKKNLKTTLENILEKQIITEIHGTGKIKTISGEEYFLKSNTSSNAYSCEANGLKELSKTNQFIIPTVYSVGDNYILTEFIESGKIAPPFYEEFGCKLAKMHHFQGPHYGFYEDNYIGDTIQLNIPSEEEKKSWTSFFFNKRLLFQYTLAEKNGNVTSKLKKGFKRLESRIDDILKDSIEPPTLMHGDLWSGNYLCDKAGNPVLIDPAVYYGHREADLAMTKIFGGFSPAFYKAYMDEFPLSDGWEYRESIYKLYHILNHLNLFGKSYLLEAEYLLSKI